MNALQQCRLTYFLSPICLVLGVLFISVVNGWGRTAHWNASSRFGSWIPELPMPAKPRVMPLALYADVWQQPLFTSDRKPVLLIVAQRPRLNLDSLEFTGTVLTGSLHVALVHDHASNKDVRIHLHDDYQGWTLAALEPRRAVFSQAGESAELILSVAAAKSVETGTAPVSDPSPESTALPAALPTTPISSASHGDSTSPSAVATQPTVSKDDAATRQAQLDALKAAVLRRREHALTAQVGH